MRGRLFFDLDGTLTDPREGIVTCLRHALMGVDVQPPPDDDLALLIGPPLQQSLRGLLGPERADLVAKALELYRVRFSAVGMFENKVYPGIPEALGALRDAGWRLCVVTSKPHAFAVPILNHFALAPFFVNVYGSELSGERTDKAELVAYALRSESAPPEQVIMIGDRSHDIVGARANRVGSRGVLWGYGSRDELEDAGAGGLFQTVEALVSELTATPRSETAGYPG